jgi:SAM-dependent methyltransferase
MKQMTQPDVPLSANEFSETTTAVPESGKPFEVQVEPEHYEWAPYHSPARWASFWHQIDEVMRVEPKSCLEVGVGSGVVVNTLRSLGVVVTAVDIEPALGIDRVGDVRDLPCKDREFDVVVCCQVLEHLPWSDVPRAVAELHRVSRAHAVVSLPQSGRPLGLSLQLPNGRRLERSDSFSARRPLVEGQEHYWQVGSPGASRRAVRRVLEGAGRFAITSEYVVPQNAYHRFYALERLPSAD